MNCKVKENLLYFLHKTISTAIVYTIIIMSYNYVKCIIVIVRFNLLNEGIRQFMQHNGCIIIKYNRLLHSSPCMHIRFY